MISSIKQSLSNSPEKIHHSIADAPERGKPWKCVTIATSFCHCQHGPGPVKTKKKMPWVNEVMSPRAKEVIGSYRINMGMPLINHWYAWDSTVLHCSKLMDSFFDEGLEDHVPFPWMWYVSSHTIKCEIVLVIRTLQCILTPSRLYIIWIICSL